MSDEEMFSEHQVTALASLAEQEPELSKLAQFARDYQAFGRAGGFVFTCAKWIAAMAVAIGLFRSGALSFLGISS